MLLIPGCSAISPSKRKSLLNSIQKIHGSICSADAVYLHLVKAVSSDAEGTLSNLDTKDRRVLDALLTYGDNNADTATYDSLKSTGRNLAYVVPRPGSISPWSSKATDIARICNLGGQIERIERGIIYVFKTSDGSSLTDSDIHSFSHLIHDRMTQVVCSVLPDEDHLFLHHPPKSLHVIDLQSQRENAKAVLSSANKTLALALSEDEIDYLVDAFVSGDNALNRDPSDAELFMFAQVNSEHCRHKIFNATWTIDGKERDMSLFQMIRNTEKLNNSNTLSAYSDNAAVFDGFLAPRFGLQGGKYSSHDEKMPILVKVETHNHPTAVSPYPGAATGSGGEIRDEGAVGQGSKPKAGLCGYAVSNLIIPGFEQPWESDFGKPSHIASALEIMLEAPLGASNFNNEFGRPNLTGYFRTFSEKVPSVSTTAGTEIRGFHKPIMIAGGLGNVRPQFVKKKQINAGAKIAVMGGPGMLIGLGGGAASSQASGSSTLELDFASVQRDNAEMQRRCQQVIDACTDLGEMSPIQSIHDVGAGGLSNALPELVHDSNLGARFEIRDVLVADTSMSPMEIWCNESQERYVLAIDPIRAEAFDQLCKRERCPYSFVGTATSEDELLVTDRLLGGDVVRLKMSTLFGKPPRMSRTDSSLSTVFPAFDCTLSSKLQRQLSLPQKLKDAIGRVLRLPSVGSKSFLVTIGDRSITGLVAREQMVGPWQVPVADVAVTRTTYGFNVLTGEAMAMGERPPIAILNPAASARLAVAESLTNLISASVKLANVKLSANWMCAASKPGEGRGLYAAVEAIGMELCPALGIGIPVGKDSMSMSMKWNEEGIKKEVSAPLSLNITAFAPVEDITATWTPQLVHCSDEDSVLVLFDLGKGKSRLGGSALAQVYKEVGSEPPDVEDAQLLKAFLEGCQVIRRDHPHVVLAYHDRSDGGLLTTIAEMCFAGRIGVDINLDAIPGSDQPLGALFNEELGAIVQVGKSRVELLRSVFSNAGFSSLYIHVVGSVHALHDETISIIHQSESILTTSRSDLQRIWAETSYRLQALRDEPAGAAEEYKLIEDTAHTGLFYDLTFAYEPALVFDARPKVAILREQGINGQVEMAWSFREAGFDAIDVHMSDIISGAVSLSEFRGMAACGGFSYGDVLGAGNGWANSVLFNEQARNEFEAFFGRQDTFCLAVCNGCQFLSHLRQIIPGTENWPDFKPNKSERFEGRTSMVEIVDNKVSASSVFLRGMGGSKLPVAVAHGEGRAMFSTEDQQARLHSSDQIAVRYVDSKGAATELYPLNPNGSPGGITGLHTPDGRVLALMPHPERVTMLEANSWYPRELRESWQGRGPWYQIFQNARTWCG